MGHPSIYLPTSFHHPSKNDWYLCWSASQPMVLADGEGPQKIDLDFRANFFCLEQQISRREVNALEAYSPNNPWNFYAWHVQLQSQIFHTYTKCEVISISLDFAWLGTVSSQIYEAHPKMNTLPSRELTYPTLGKGKSSSKCHFGGIC